MEGTPFAYYGEPVMIPGSMGSSSYLMRGMGNPQSLWSASHGAGRRLSRERRYMEMTGNLRNL
ncbi:MAG: RtcB family protein [Enterocloster bolteae]